MERFRDGWLWGLVVAFLAVMIGFAVLAGAFAFGHDYGWRAAFEAQERAGGGRWIEVTLDGRKVSGWLR